MKRFFLLAALALPHFAFAEWRTEYFPLKAGWNAIYPSVDAGHTTIDLIPGINDVAEIWRWQPERVDPRLPGDINAPPAGVEWSVWKRGVPQESNFERLSVNYGYLVRLDDTAQPQTLALKGRAAVPEVRWRGDGIHLAGFPVVTSGTKPTFAAYLAPTGFALGNAEILRYVGGPIAQGVNPATVVPSVNRIEPGQAYWIRVEKFSRYYGPLKVETDAGGRVDFGTRANPVQVLLTNQTTSSLTVTVTSVSSESAPSGQPSVAGDVPLLAEVDAETAFTPLSTLTITVPGGGILPVRLAIDRQAMAGAVGARFASLLQITTTAGVAGEQVFVPVTAEVGSLAGLWIGEAEITHVGSIVRRYERNAAGETVYDANGRPRIIEDLTTPQNGGTLPGVARSYPLRLILHVNAGGQATLLSHVLQGKFNTTQPGAPLVLTTSQSALDPAALRDAVRLSVAHLPLDTALALGGAFTTGATLSNATPLTTPYDAAGNPFVHAYHPDHDNLDARFANPLPAGVESFTIQRQFTLGIDSVAPAGTGTSWGTTTLTGTYAEVIEGPYKSPLRVQGQFGLYKVSDIPVLTNP